MLALDQAGQGVVAAGKAGGHFRDRGSGSGSLFELHDLEGFIGNLIGSFISGITGKERQVVEETRPILRSFANGQVTCAAGDDPLPVYGAGSARQRECLRVLALGAV